MCRNQQRSVVHMQGCQMVYSHYKSTSLANFTRIWNWKFWDILWSFGVYICWPLGMFLSFGMFCPVLVCCANKRSATLVVWGSKVASLCTWFYICKMTCSRLATAKFQNLFFMPSPIVRYLSYETLDLCGSSRAQRANSTWRLQIDNKHITLHYITLHYITLHYITLHYITLHYITLHYITLHYKQSTIISEIVF
jgi:hypothetical protein